MTSESVLAFAAARDRRMRTADDELRPLVARALAGWTESGEWYAEVVEGASVLWLEIFEVEAPNADPDRFIAAFQRLLGDTLAKTGEPDDPPSEGQIEKITRWLSAMSINDATYHGNRARGGRGMRWTTMGDGDVRDSHRVANGQIADRDGTFDIGGNALHYPGEPVGPPEVWINCRCVLTPARVEGALAVTDAITAAGDPEVDAVPEIDPDEGVEMVPDELEDDEEAITEIPVHGVATIEGRPTGDGRQFAVGALSFAALPQPLGFEFESAHGGDNSRVAIVGRIDRFFTVDSPDGDYKEARWSGVIFTDKPYADQALQGIIDGSYQGVSVIIDAVEVDVSEERERVIRDVEASRKAEASDGEGTEEEMTPEEIADLFVGDGSMPVTTFSKARIRRFDMVPTPAFAEAYIAVGDRFYDELSDEEKRALDECGCGSGVQTPESAPDEDDNPSIQRGEDEDDDAEGIAASASFAPGTKDGPGWITHPVPTSRIRRYWVRGKGAAKIRWGVPGDFNRCRRQLAKYVQNPEWLAGLCANMHKEAIGVWPGQEGGRHANSSTGIVASLFALVASGRPTKPAEAFKNPNLTGPTALTIEGDRIFGHIATWGVCHIGVQGECVTAPHSSSNYAMFRTGVVTTEEGDIPVGQITMGTGHADVEWGTRRTLAHYDNTGTVVADIATGEDAWGIWFSGMLRPGLTDEQIDALAASALSGDWRPTMTGYELVAALAVNVPGFPVPRMAIAASGAMTGVNVVPKTTEDVAKYTELDLDHVVSLAVAKYRAAEARQKRLAALAPFYNRAKAARVSSLADFFGKE